MHCILKDGFYFDVLVAVNTDTEFQDCKIQYLLLQTFLFSQLHTTWEVYLNSNIINNIIKEIMLLLVNIYFYDGIIYFFF